MKEFPRVLIISHNVFSTTGAMGKSMASMLACVPPDNLAQLYFHSEVPTIDNCHRYFRIVDGEVLKSVFTRKPGGRRFGESDICKCAVTSRTDGGVSARVYQHGRNRTPLTYRMRNAVWKLGIWDSVDLYEWIDDFDPDVIFFASGDYEFSYQVTEMLARAYNLPVIMWCCDDYYISDRFPSARASRRYRDSLLSRVSRLSDFISHIIVISDKMKVDYGDLFSAPITPVRISARRNEFEKSFDERRGIVFAGNLGVGRMSSLLQLSRALKDAAIPGYDCIHVYTTDRNPKTLAQLTAENGIDYRGAALACDLSAILGSARYLVHVEAFDEGSKARTRYSLSTKIGESLASGACILAYGPADISSMEYLREHDAAVMLNAAEDVVSVLCDLNEDPVRFERICQSAQQLALSYHDEKKNDAVVYSIIASAVLPARLNSSRKAISFQV